MIARQGIVWPIKCWIVSERRSPTASAAAGVVEVGCVDIRALDSSDTSVACLIDMYLSLVAWGCISVCNSRLTRPKPNGPCFDCLSAQSIVPATASIAVWGALG